MPLPSDLGQAILELEARHEEMFRLLEDLEKRVANVLGQYQVGRKEPPPLAMGAPVPANATPEPKRTAA